MKRTSLKVMAAVATLFSASHLHAQELSGGLIAQNQSDGQAAINQAEINNGTNPTLLTTRAGIQYEYNKFTAGQNSGLWEAYASLPFGANKNMSLELTLPYASGPTNDSYGLGDVSLKFTHIVSLNASRGIAYQAELFADTADRPDLGTGQTVLELSAFYAKFLSNGAIFAPAWVQTFGLGDEDPGRARISRTTLDFYYVPKLANPKFFITADPALVYDWENDKKFASLQVTFGMLTGKAFGGDSQIFIKPGIYGGADRPLDWSVQVGYRVLNF